MGFCLPKEDTNKLLAAVGDGSFNPDTYADQPDTPAREAYVAKFVSPENVTEVNTLMESKMLLKDWKSGMVTAVKKLTGLTESAKTDIISKIQKMDKLLSPADTKSFYADITAKRLGADVNIEEANQVAKLAKDAGAARDAIKPTDPIKSDSRLDYGAKTVALQNYISDLKHSVDQSGFDQFKKAPISTAITEAKKIFSLSKAIKNVGDLSSLFHQGWKALTTHPVIWAKNAMLAFKDAGMSLGVKGTDNTITDAIKAEIISRPNALDGTYQKMGLDIGNTEEQLPSRMPEKIPLFGRLYKATETGFTGFLYRTRADVADLYIKMAKDNGVDMTDKTQAQSIGNMVNALTGRGKTSGVTSDTNFVNAAIYSQKLLKSNFDFLTAHQFQTDVTPFVRKQAAIALVKSVVATAAVLQTANMLLPGSVNWNPLSSNFGKIKVGKIAFDVTGGNGSMIVLANRLIQNKTMTSKGKISDLNTGKFGAQTSQDVISDYLTNKLSPVASVALDLVNRSAFGGAPLTVQGEAENAFAPFPVANTIEGASSVGMADSIVGEIFDSLGLYETLPYVPPKKK